MPATGFWLAALVTAASLWDEGPRVRVAIMEVQVSAAMGSELGRSLTETIASHLDGLRLFDTLSMQDIDKMLAVNALKEQLGCSDVSKCMAELAGALGVAYVVSGSVLYVGEVYLIQMQLLNSQQSVVEKRIEREFQGGPSGLLAEARTVTSLLVRDLLAERSGTLRLTVAEEGATVRLDGQIIGVTPMAPVRLPGGVHQLRVEKEGFIVEQKDVSIYQDQELAVALPLRPSLEFVRAYRADAQSRRRWALGAGAVGLVIVGAGAGSFWHGNRLMVALTKEAERYNASEQRPAVELESLQARQQTIATWDLASVLALGIGALTTTASAVAFGVSDDPERYDARAP